MTLVRHQIVLRLAIAAAVLLAMLLALFQWPNVYTHENFGRESRFTSRQFATVLVLIDQYDSHYKRLPQATFADDAGTPLSSWRFQASRFLSLDSRDPAPRAAWDKPWDAKENHWWAVNAAGAFCVDESRNPAIVAIIGEGTPLGGGSPVRLADLSGDCILLVELAATKGHWMEPGDISLEALEERIESRTVGHDPTGFFVGFADGEVWFLTADTPWYAVKPFTTITESHLADRDAILGPYRREPPEGE